MHINTCKLQSWGKFKLLIYFWSSYVSNLYFSLRDVNPISCHCEERSDEVIYFSHVIARFSFRKSWQSIGQVFICTLDCHDLKVSQWQTCYWSCNRSNPVYARFFTRLLRQKSRNDWYRKKFPIYIIPSKVKIYATWWEKNGKFLKKTGELRNYCKKKEQLNYGKAVR